MTDRELAQPEPWVKTYCGGKPNYTTQPTGQENRQVAKNATSGWVGLTDQEYAHEQQKAWNEVSVVDGVRTGEYSQILWQFIEAKLKEKNT